VTTAGSSRLRDVASKPPWRRMSRYTVGSVICFGVAEATFVVLFQPHILGARGASIAASIAGIIPGYTLNRRWTWGRRGQSDLWREVVPYWVVALVSTAAAALATGAANAAFAAWSRDARTIINATAYMATYGVLFVAKYVIFDQILFADRAGASGAASASDDSDDSGDDDLTVQLESESDRAIP
jgi:putative flippase GtrA